MTNKPVGLVLSGGAARGAYQAGVMKAIAHISRDGGLDQPIPIITGVSAGAINAAYLAARADEFTTACEGLAKLWCTLRTEQVFRTDPLTAGKLGFRFLFDAVMGAMYSKKLARSLLDTAPLRLLLSEQIDFSRIGQNIKNGVFQALAISAMNYSNAHSITFVQGDNPPNWDRTRRRSQHSPIGIDHVMASSAIPIFFPPVAIGNDHYGDGCLRNIAPLSPAIHLGADRLIVVSVRRPDSKAVDESHIDPTIARILGVVLNALMLDAVEMDLERMLRVNNTLQNIPNQMRSDLSLRAIEVLWIRPSQDIGHLAGDKFHRLPAVLRYLMGGLGSSKESSELTSYLLFDPEYCGQLVEIGYKDAMDQAEAILKFLTV